MNNKNIFETLKKAEKGAKISIAAYLILSFLKLFIGYYFYSDALFADGINNATDVISSIFVLIGLKISRKPADADHLYGHFRAELIATLIASFIMLYAGLEVVLFSAKRLLKNELNEPQMPTIIVSIVAAVIMLAVFYYNFRLSKKLNSKSLKAASFDNLSDALVSIGTLAGIGGTLIGIRSADAIAALIVGCLIIYTAITIFKEATHILTDGVEAETIEEITSLVEKIDEVIEIKEVRGRSHGIVHFIDITVTVDPHLNVRQSHDITVKIEETLHDNFIACETLVHLEPAE